MRKAREDLFDLSGEEVKGDGLVESGVVNRGFETRFRNTSWSRATHGVSDSGLQSDLRDP